MAQARLRIALNSPLISIGHVLGAELRGGDITREGGKPMRLIVGVVLVFLCVFGGYAAMGGKLGVLWQPFEFVIILGAAIGAFVIGNPAPVLKAVPACSAR